MSFFVTITECVDRAGQQLLSNPRSGLSRTLMQWARDDAHVDPVNGLYSPELAAHKWIQSGYLNPAFLPLDGPYDWVRETAADAFNIWQTARLMIGLPPL